MNRSVIRATSLSLLSASFLLAACDARPTAPETATRPVSGPTRTVDPFLMDPIVVDGCADNQCAESGGGGGGSITVPPDYIPPPPPPEPGAGGGPVYSPDEAYGPGLWIACTAALLGTTASTLSVTSELEDYWRTVHNLREVQKKYNRTVWTAESVKEYFDAKEAVRRQAVRLGTAGIATAAAALAAAQICSPGLALPTV